MNTLLWWGRAYCVFPNMPSLRSVRLVEPIDEAEAVDVDDVESVGPVDEVTAVEEAETLQEMVFTLRTALHDCMRHAGASAGDILRAADRHALALENLVHALGEEDATGPFNQRAITG
ncbi:hypothetical protein [Nocardia shimofusensis]|uniref:hypothetical protein n=1 Tax=Nocardia shimofusensis TaxID=228596 RepID=UPI00082E3213|nr:hypothetical protein [Nocardia shimofusensis]